jgi:beta-1,4-mannosyl-glycoprotein beta-1,4-N-acetylglucosaminyltransferase
MPKIYDCFCYFNEDMILELRFETLWDYVDYFIISEANYTHAGAPRELLFNLEKFAKYKKKIRYLPLIERPPGKNEPWKNENFIRNNVAKGLYDALPDDWILISDIDEIPRPKKIKEYNPKRLRAQFMQGYYNFFFNNFWLGCVNEKGRLKRNSNRWYGSTITTFARFSSFFESNATYCRSWSYKPTGLFPFLKKEWFKHFKRQVIRDGGWHFSSIFDISGIVLKTEVTAHQEFNTPEYKDPQNIQMLILQGRDFRVPSRRFQAHEVCQPEFPAYLVEHMEKYEKFLLPAAKNFVEK